MLNYPLDREEGSTAEDDHKNRKILNRPKGAGSA